MQVPKRSCKIAMRETRRLHHSLSSKRDSSEHILNVTSSDLNEHEFITAEQSAGVLTADPSSKSHKDVFHFSMLTDCLRRASYVTQVQSQHS